MRKIYSLLLLGGLLLFGAQSAEARWVGASAINVNGSWFRCSTHDLNAWAGPNYFNGYNLGTISHLYLGGQSQVYSGDEGGNWDWGSGTMQMFYKIDDGSWTECTLTYFGYAENNNKLQSGGSTFTPEIVNISGLSAGNHTISIYFKSNTAYDSNNSANYVATFTIPSSVSKAISSAGWATYCSGLILDFSGSITNLTDVYVVTGGAAGVLTKTSVKGKKVQANTGLLIKGSEGTVTIPVVASGANATVTGNKLVGVNEATTLDLDGDDDGTPDQTVYVLMNDATYGLGFYLTSTTSFTLGANTAYLPSDFTGSGAPARFWMEDDATNIQNIEAGEKAVKFIQNGQLFIMREGVVYDATGRAIR